MLDNQIEQQRTNDGGRRRKNVRGTWGEFEGKKRQSEGGKEKGNPKELNAK